MLETEINQDQIFQDLILILFNQENKEVNYQFDFSKINNFDLIFFIQLQWQGLQKFL